MRGPAETDWFYCYDPCLASLAAPDWSPPLCVPKTLNPTIVVMKSGQDGAEWHRCAVPRERLAHPCSKIDIGFVSVGQTAEVKIDTFNSLWLAAGQSSERLPGCHRIASLDRCLQTMMPAERIASHPGTNWFDRVDFKR